MKALLFKLLFNLFFDSLISVAKKAAARTDNTLDDEFVARLAGYKKAIAKVVNYS